MYFYTIEAFDSKISNFAPDIDTSQISKMTIISEDYEYDIQAHAKLEEILENALSVEISNFDIDLNPMYFPSNADISDEELAMSILLEEDIEHFNLHTNFFNDEEDNLPTFFDLMMASYNLVDDSMDTIEVRGAVLTTPSNYQYINFDQDIMVH